MEYLDFITPTNVSECSFKQESKRYLGRGNFIYTFTFVDHSGTEQCIRVASDNYNRVIQLGKKATVNQSFNNSEEKIALAWSFYHQKDNVTSRRLFEEMNILHDIYKNGLEYAKGLLETLQEEFSSINRIIIKPHKPIINGVKTLYKEI